MSRVDIFAQINQERDRQDELHGGPSHDRSHLPAEWVTFIGKYARKAGSCARTADGGANEASLRLAALRFFRYHLIQVAALAVAAVEAFDANNPSLKPGRNDPVRPKDL